MSIRAEAILSKFMRRATSRLAGYTRVCLYQIVSSGGSSLLKDTQLNPEFSLDESALSIIVAEFLTTAQEDADSHRGPSTYCLIAYKGVTKGERSPVFRLRSQESDFEDDALSDSEPATKDGHLAQLMRHNETLMRLLVQSQEVSANQSTNIIARQVETIRHYEDRHFEVIVRAEELANEKEEREQSRIALIGSEKRKEQVMALLKPLVPIAMAKFKGTPSSAKPDLWKESIKQILSDVTPEKMEKLAEILGPHSLALAEIWMDAHKESDSPDDSTEANSPSEAH